MGYQPGLDGLRAISVIAVIFYHAGFPWMHGGFFGVEVFFVVSGFLITMLLIEEREKSDGVSLSQFWLRRRSVGLFPALFLMLFAVAAWRRSSVSAEQTSRLAPRSAVVDLLHGQLGPDRRRRARTSSPAIRRCSATCGASPSRSSGTSSGRSSFTFLLAGKRPGIASSGGWRSWSSP